MTHHVRCALIGALLPIAFFLKGQDACPLEKGFREPPMDSRPSFYFLLFNGYLNREYLPPELQYYKDTGFGGLCLFDMGARGDKSAQRWQTRHGRRSLRHQQFGIWVPVGSSRAKPA